jgi:hypothetical protein
MKILALIRNPEELPQVEAYAQRVSGDDDLIHFAHLISVPGEVPTKKNGEVLDDCTEFDLTQYYNEAAMARRWMASGLQLENATHSVHIGRVEHMAKALVYEHEAHVILTSTEFTSESGDFFKESRGGLLLQNLDIPVLTFKCDRSKEHIETIAIVSDFRDEELMDLHVVKQIRENNGAKVVLHAFCENETEREEMESRMKAFTNEYGMGTTELIITATEDKEQAVADLIMEHRIQLMVVTDIHRKGLKRIIKGSLEKDILNHTLVPILAY